MTLALTRPLIIFDLETTGINIATARIVEIATIRIEPNGRESQWYSRVNPLVPIPAESTAIHGLTDADVADAPPFKQLGQQIIDIFRGADICGFNSTRFDVPLLIEECRRYSIPFDVNEHQLVDALRIFQIMEPHTLAAAYRKFCGEELVNAHSALADTMATRDVLFAQLEHYADQLPSTIAELATLCAPSDRFADVAGRLIYNAEGDIVFNFGKYKGQSVRSILGRNDGYYEWFMRAEFPESTKEVMQKIWLEMRCNR